MLSTTPPPANASGPSELELAAALPQAHDFPHREGRVADTTLQLPAQQATAEILLRHYLPVDTGAEQEDHKEPDQRRPHYQHPGTTSRPRLLLIHGFRGDHHGMQLIVDALPEFEIYVPDLPGFGGSEPARRADGSRIRHDVEVYADVVGALADQLGFTDHDVLLGHSFGTIITAAHTARAPHRWAGLVLSAPVAQDVFRGRLLAGAAAVEAYYRLTHCLPEPVGNAILRSSVILEVTNLSLGVRGDPALAAYVKDQHRRYFSGYSDRATLLEAYWASSRHTVTHWAEYLDLPVLVSVGAHDQLSTVDGRRVLRDALPQGRMETLRGAGHLVHYERPVQMARALRRFTSSL